MNETQSSAKAARPFGLFEWMVSRRYLGATRKGAGVSLISSIAVGGIALSVTALIVVMSVFQGFRITVLDQLLSVNGHVFVTQAGAEMTNYDDVASRIRKVPGVERVTPTIKIPTWAVGPAGQGGGEIHGVGRDELLEIDDVVGTDHLIGGSLENFGVGRNGGSDIAIATRLASKLGVWAGDPVTLITAGGAETAMGRVPTTEKTYRVAAVFRIGNSALDEFYIYMPLEQAQLFGRKKGIVDEIEVRVDKPLNIDPMIGPIMDAAGPEHYVVDWRDRNRGYFNALQVERAAMRIIMMFLVALSTMLIVSGLVMMVKDKRSDIAVLRTMGATGGSIVRIFVLIGGTIGVIGAGLGVIFGTLIANNMDPIEKFLSWVFRKDLFPAEIYMLDGVPSVFEWAEVRNVVVFTLLMSFLAAVYPAWRASKVDPVEALRYE